MAWMVGSQSRWEPPGSLGQPDGDGLVPDVSQIQGVSPTSVSFSQSSLPVSGAADSA